METRRFGRTGHMSTVAIFGAFALSRMDQVGADALMEQVREAGINHIDVAPSYGVAEERLGAFLAGERKHFFLGCKTMERTRAGAAAELQRSLQRLQVGHFDLYQLHAIKTFQELDEVTGPGGALEAIIEAHQAGLTRFIGITGHGLEAPAVFLEALRRFDFDSILFPLNFILFAQSTYRAKAEELLRQCRPKDVGTMIIKSIARQPWGKQPKTHNTWYQPFTEPEIIQQAVNFVLSQDVTGLCTAGDSQVLPLVLQACANYTTMSRTDQEALIGSAINYESIFA